MTHDFGIQCSSNKTHDPVLGDATVPGGRLAGRYRETPDEDALTFDAVVRTLTLTISPTQDAVSWQAVLAVDGSPKSVAADEADEAAESDEA